MVGIGLIHDWCVQEVFMNGVGHKGAMVDCGHVEAVWGAAPLETTGGFHILHFNEKNAFRSPLGSNGAVSGQKVASKPTKTHASSSFELTVRSELDYPSFGVWFVLQYQGWIRDNLEVRGASLRRVVLFPDNVFEIWVNNEHVFGGDYTFRRPPIVKFASAHNNVKDRFSHNP
jgi:hypothetical protein